jgi:hypothetical protein
MGVDFRREYSMAIFKKCPHCGQPTIDRATRCQCGFDFEKWKNTISIFGVIGAPVGVICARAASGSFVYALPAAMAGLGAGVVVGIFIMKAKVR